MFDMDRFWGARQSDKIQILECRYPVQCPLHGKWAQSINKLLPILFCES